MQWSAERECGNKAAGQFSTPEWVAELLCSRLQTSRGLVADLGIGKGALALALSTKSLRSNIIGIDNYPAPAKNLAAMRRAGIVRIRRDVGSADFSEWFVRRYGHAGAVISNPPFTYIDDHPHLRELLSAHGLMTGERRQRLDLIFLAHAMRMLSPEGMAAFILPVSAFSMARSITNLTTMVASFGLTELIKLPCNLYEDAEVQTAALIFNKAAAGREREHFAVSEATPNGALKDIGLFSATELVKYFSHADDSVTAPSNSLTAIGGTVARGRHSSRKLLNAGVSHFHTTSFARYPRAEVVFESVGGKHDLDVPASKGDILIPRVGTRCLGRAAIVVQGSSHISDCVFRISTPAKKRRQVWEFLSSEAGSAWQQSLARGACAKFITQQDLLTAPLPVTVR